MNDRNHIARLKDFAGALCSAPDYHSLLDIISKQVRRILNAENLLLWIYDDKGHALRCEASSLTTLDHGLVREVRPADSGLLGEMLRADAPRAFAFGSSTKSDGGTKSEAASSMETVRLERHCLRSAQWQARHQQVSGKSIGSVLSCIGRFVYLIGRAIAARCLVGWSPTNPYKQCLIFVKASSWEVS
jgi:hypothetical protein